MAYLNAIEQSGWRRWCRRVRVAEILAVGLVASPSFAAPSPIEVASAQELFDQARGLFASGRIHEACEKFQASQGLEPQLGTLLNLGICHEKEGKTATAWREFTEARLESVRVNSKDREQFAADRAAALAPLLSHLVVVVEGLDVEGLLISLDDSPLRRVAWNTELPVDPGSHTLVVSAPGIRPWKSTFVAEGPTTTAIAIPALGPVHAAIARSSSSSAPASAATLVPTLVWVGASTGFVGIGLGTFFGIEAISRRHEAESTCSSVGCTSDAYKANDEAKRDAWISDLAFAVGVGGAVLGAYVYLSSGRAGTSSAPTSTRLGMGPSGLSLSGVF